MLPSEARRVLDFWFPDGCDASLEAHRDYWGWRMGGGAHQTIVAEFSELTKLAARGGCDVWANSALGRLALIVVLDQFSRSVWQGSPLAFAQDNRALELTLEGYDNGHYDELPTPWHKAFFSMPVGHAEGPEHAERLKRLIPLARALVAEAPEHLRPIYEFNAQQPSEVLQVIQTFGRHTHRNSVLGRKSTSEELEYINRGEFPHNRAMRQGLVKPHGG